MTKVKGFSRKLRILWFAVTPSLYGRNTVRHNGGGWVASLERILRGAPDVELGISFEYNDDSSKRVQDGVTYYPICANAKIGPKLGMKLGMVDECDSLIAHARTIIADFQPDVIHVFGSESCFGLLGAHTNIPVIIHMQGSLPSYANARFPPGYSRFDYLRASRGNPTKLYRLLSNDAVFCKRALREENILRNCQHFMGRTEWDEAIAAIYNPEGSYSYCSEALRSEIYDHAHSWSPHSGRRLELVSTLSMPLYKGADMILKTAHLLHHELGIEFRWQVFGVSQCRLQEAKTGIRAQECGVSLMGVAEGAVIRDALLEADLYVHPSYIDNSPNSLCEAQVLGVPVVATNVGGIPSLVEHGSTGFLVAANDPYMMARRISQLIDDQALATRFGQSGRKIARARHAPDRILSDLLAIYAKHAKIFS
jgi:glycosyltransferase involved in cell wall biosynthesis